MASALDIPAPERVLIIKPSALGDVVTALPVLRGLRRTFGRGLHVAWMLSRPCIPLVADDEDLDEVIAFDRRRLGRMWWNPGAMWAFLGLWRQLRRGHYDWVIDLQGLFRSGFFARATRAPVRAGFAAAREGAAMFYTHALPAADTPAHTVDRNIALAGMLGVDVRPDDFRLTVPPAGREWARQFAAERGADYVVVAPATRWVTKLYPTRHWQRVITELARRTTVVLVAGAGETHLTGPLAGGDNVIDLGGRTSLPQLLGLIAGARGLISCDSATMNIATALACPQVTIVGPTDPARTGPYRRDDAVVRSALPCLACLKRACPHIACMQTLDPTEVLAAADRVLFAAARPVG